MIPSSFSLKGSHDYTEFRLSSSLQSTQNGGLNYVPGSDKQISPTTNDFNPAITDGISYDFDLSLKSSSSPSSASAQTADDLKPFFATGDTRHPYHKNCPDSLDCLPDTSDRPQHTLPVILRCAILGSAKGKLTIRDIYAAMENKYPYYRTAGPAWKVRFITPCSSMDAS